MRKLFVAMVSAFGASFVLTVNPAAAHTSHHVSKSHHALTTKTAHIGKIRVGRVDIAAKKRHCSARRDLTLFLSSANYRFPGARSSTG